MRRYKVTIAYDGTGFAGFQVQPDERTIQGVLETRLSKIAKGSPITVHGSGRTDSGVHALGQVIHFDFPFGLSEYAMKQALNTNLPHDLVAKKVEKVDDDFHARLSALEKTYFYRVHNSKTRNPLTRYYAYWHPFDLDIDRLKKALSYIEGEHDFTSFASTKSSAKNKVRTVFEARLDYHEARQEYVFTFRGNGFLYNMIRVIMGTLLEIGDGRKEPEEMQRLLEVRDRNEAGPTASPVGLFLKEVVYPDTGGGVEKSP